MATKVWQLLHKTQGLVYPIEKSPTILGRSNDCDLVVDDPSVSHQHLQFNIENRTLVIHDLNSANGTFFNGKRIKSVKIKASDRCVHLKLGVADFDITYGSPLMQEQSAYPQGDDQSDFAKYFFSSNGAEHGPLTLAQIDEAVAQGVLRPTDDFWEDGMTFRCKAFEVEGLFTNGATNSSAGITEGARLASGALICPYCWNRIQPEDLLFIASHPDLLGDPVLGADELQRFLPTRFTPEGLAIDAGGVISPDMACPTCHMRLPSSVTNQPPLFMSIVGAPGSGKSYFLASAVWRLRTTLPKHFGVHFMDVDATTNQWLNDYEEKLFFQIDEEGFQTIAKTDMQAPSVYRNIKLNNMQVSLPLPSLFSLHAATGFEEKPNLPPNRTLVLYDNAGEHFQAGADSAATPGTKHLVHAEGILFLFDPTEDPRFRSILTRDKSSAVFSAKTHRQDILLIETIGRIRKYLGMSSNDRIRKTVIVGISKADLLVDLLPMDGDPWRISPGSKAAALDMQVIKKMSASVRNLLEKFAPEIVATVESFAESVLYVPNSALGHHPSKEGIRPVDIKPKWVEVPLLYILSRLGYVRVVDGLQEA